MFSASVTGTSISSPAVPALRDDQTRLPFEFARYELRTLEQAKRLLPADTELSPDRVGVASSFFEVTGRLRLEERVLEQRSIIERRGLEMRVIARYRASQLLDQPAGGRS